MAWSSTSTRCAGHTFRPVAALLAQPTTQERAVLGPIRYQATVPCCHTDTSVRRAPRCVGCVELRTAAAAAESARVCLHSSSTSCSRCRLPSPWWCRSPPCATSRPNTSLAATSTPTRCSTCPRFARSSSLARSRGVSTLFCGAWTGYAFMKTASVGSGGGRAIASRYAGCLWRRLRESSAAHVVPPSASARCATRGCGPKSMRLLTHSFFLMLPMRSLSGAQSALAVNRRGAISFHDTDHGDGRSAAQGGRWPGSTSCCAPKALTTRRARSGCTVTPAVLATLSSP